MEVPQADHVLDALHRRRVHGLDAPLRGQPLLLVGEGEVSGRCGCSWWEGRGGNGGYVVVVVVVVPGGKAGGGG